MIHIRTDDNELNSNATFACGISLAELRAAGDKAYHYSEALADLCADCPKCNPRPRQLGTPLSQLSGRPGHPGFQSFWEIARSWGYD
jgi:hypothetical protein